MSIIEKGTAVILNECDAPENRLIAIALKQDKNELWLCEYLNNTLRKKYGAMNPSRPTPIRYFGRRLIMCRKTGTFWTEDISDIAPPCATYSNGEPRSWQCRNPPVAYDHALAKKIRSADRHCHY